jgi:hypothetical protein
MSQLKFDPQSTNTKVSFTNHIEAAPVAAAVVGDGNFFSLELYLNGNPIGLLGINDSGWCVLVQANPLLIRDYPLNSVIYLQTKDGQYLSVSGNAYIGAYGWSGAAGWKFEDSGLLLSLENNQHLALYSIDNAFLYSFDTYSELTVKRVYA